MGGPRGECVLVRHALRHIVPNPFAQAVVVVTRIVDGQQPTVFGVQNKEQSVQEDQGSVTDVRQRPFLSCHRSVFLGPRQGLHQAWKHTLKDDARQIAGHLLFVPAPFGQGDFKEGGAAVWGRREGLTAKQEMENPQVLFPARPQELRQIGLIVSAGPRPGAVVVEPPHRAVGKYAPPNTAVRGQMGGFQITQNLTVRRVSPPPLVRVPYVKRQAEALALLHDQSAGKAGTRLPVSSGACL